MTTIDKEFDPIEAASVRGIYTAPVHRIICQRMLIEIERMWGNLRIGGFAVTAANVSAAKIGYLNNDKSKMHLYSRLQVLLKQRESLATELLIQYGQEHGTYATFDHDLLCQMFAEQAVIVEEHIKNGEWAALYTDKRTV